MALLIISLLFLNLMFFFLIVIAGVSQASVEGVASLWLHAIFIFWVVAHIPYVFYIINVIRSKKDEKKFVAIKLSISRSAWLAFPGGVALFMFFGSKIPWAAAVIPSIQTLIAVVVYLRNK